MKNNKKITLLILVIIIISSGLELKAEQVSLTPSPLGGKCNRHWSAPSPLATLPSETSGGCFGRGKGWGEGYLPFTSGLAEINQLQTYNYTYKSDKTKTPHVGVIAQDLQKVFPDAVTKDQKRFLQIRQEDMFYAMINAIKQLASMIEDLRTAIKTIDVLVAKLEAKTNEIMKREQINSQKIKIFEKEITLLEKEPKISNH